MSDQPRIVAFAGSARKDSLNLQLVKVAAEGARAAGAEVTVLDMRDFPMPLFNQDLEEAEGPPENGRELRRIMLAHDGLLIASPEYNSSITPLLKNAIDWVSRADEGNRALAAYEPGFPICLPRMVPLYTREPPSARNFVRRPIGRLQRLSPQPAVTWKRLEPLLSGHFSDTAPHVCHFFAMRASLH